MIYDLFSARYAVDVNISSTDHTVSTADNLGPRALWVGGAGTLVCVFAGSPNGASSSFTVPAGTMLLFELAKVVKSGTTCTEMKFLY